MRNLLLGAAVLTAMTSGALAQDFNPGTVVGNVFQNPASGCGCGYGSGCCPPAATQYPNTAVYRHHVHRKARKQADVRH
jgi:hypothetical protein